MNKEDKQVFHLRKTCGLPALVAKQRRCLQCCDMFDSEGSHNRVCGRCKRLNALAQQSAGFLLGLGKADDQVYKEV